MFVGAVTTDEESGWQKYHPVSGDEFSVSCPAVRPLSLSQRQVSLSRVGTSDQAPVSFIMFPTQLTLSKIIVTLTCQAISGFKAGCPGMCC